MTESPRVSVIIPALNAANVIVETLESLRAQTFQDFEAIIVDDGSTDATAEIARRFCESDPRFLLFQQSHGGTAVARNTAIEKSRGEWMAFLDADDVWLPQKLERQMTLSAEDPRVNFLFSNYYFWDVQRDSSTVYYRDHRPLPDGNALRQLIFGDVYRTSTVMVRRQTLLDVGLFDPALKFCQDWDLWLRIARRGICAKGLRQPLVRYRRWPGSCTVADRFSSSKYHVQVLEKFYRETPDPTSRALCRRSLNFARGRIELFYARQTLERNPDAVSASIWRAWQHYPQRLKWLMWLALVLWPKFLGGNATRKIVHQKLVQKF
jgi:glycosyltransferase involved in cell wall biosynthesis